MKGLFVGALLLAAGKIYAQNAECSNELLKYSDCISEIDVGSMGFDSKEHLDAFCKSFTKDVCKDFVADVSKSKSACMNTEKPVMTDITIGNSFYAMKLPYLIYCTKPTKGNSCPLAEYITTHYEEIATNVVNKQDVTLTEAQLKAIADDCRDVACNARMTAVQEITDVYSKVSEASAGTADSSATLAGADALYKKFIDSYKNKKCGAIDNSNNDGDFSSSSSGSGTSTTGGKTDGKSDNTSGSTTLKITSSFVIMMILSIFMLL